MADVSPVPALGVSARLGISTAAPTTVAYDFESETLGLRESFLDPQGLRGTRSHAANRVRPSGRLVTGDIEMSAPTAVEINNLLPWITGSAGSSSGSGNNFALAEALPTARYVDLLRGGTLFRYSGCQVARAVFSARKGTAVRLALSVLGIDETEPGGAFPSLTLDNTTSFFIFEDSDAAVTIAGTTISCFEWSLTIDNVLQPRMVNSQTAQTVYSTDRIVTQAIRVPWGDAESLYGLAQAGVATSVQFTNANTSFKATAPAWQVPRQSPDVRGRDEIVNELVGVCRNDGTSNDEVLLFCDASP